MGSPDGATVEFKPSAADNDVETGGTVEIQSPAKNRYQGSPVMPNNGVGSERRKSSIPILFERSAHSWWNPKFDSEILEKQHMDSSYPKTRQRFQYAILYVLVACIAWSIFLGVLGQEHWLAYMAGLLVLLAISVILLILTFTQLCKRALLSLSTLFALSLCAFCLLSFIQFSSSPISAVGTFTMTIEVLLLMYAMIPLPLYLAICFGVALSLSYEGLSIALVEHQEVPFVIGRILMHCAMHFIGIHLFIMSQVRKRSTFLKVGQSILSRRDLNIEKELKQKMINSLMPQSVAEEVMRQRTDKENEDDYNLRNHNKKRLSKSPDRGIITFRSFHMSQMDSVSILFADIVGFTKMSSNKTAEHLVSLLNDLFGRFDIICQKSGCEKISTLGDCYYCVSGCPEGRPDHAMCCVEMGLMMCRAIIEFDEDHNEEVNMRVGVHTGTVLCGIVGTRRFKFDVWSHDVTLANMMESEGRPGKVHISDSTYVLIKDEFEVEPGEEVEDIRKHKVLIEDYNTETQQYVVRHVREVDSIRTWFIVCRKNSPASPQIAPVSLKEIKDGEVIESDKVNVTIKDEGRSQVTAESTSSVVAESPKPDSVVSPSNHTDDPNTTSTEGDTGQCHTNGLSKLRTSRCPPPTDPTIMPLLASHLELDASSHLSLLTGGRLERQGSCVRNESSSSVKDRYNHTSEIIVLKAPQDMSTAVLLGKRETIATSIEDISGEARENGRGAMSLGLQLSSTRPRIHEEIDRELINCMQNDPNVAEYLYYPPINRCTLNFLSQRLEENYRNHYVDMDGRDTIATFALPRYSSLCDIIVSFTFFVLMSVACFIGFPLSLPWLLVFVVSLLLEMAMLLPALGVTCCRHTSMAPFLNHVGRFFAGWVPQHLFGGIIISVPAAAIYSNFSCSVFHLNDSSDFYFCLLLVVSIVHYCNFTMLSSWLRAALASIVGIVLVILLTTGICTQDTSVDANVSSTADPMLLPEVFSGEHALKYEVILTMLLLLLLIWFLTREFEISYRLSFHGNVQAAMDRQTMQQEKEQADWLLHNIIPEHVSEVLKQTSQYCKNHKDVGVIFAKVVNYDDFYDESFEGGKEYLRVLNEMIGDFEDLFDNPKYKDVEKIKTIGSCLMAASGLNPGTRNQNQHPNAHLFALMDFAVDMLKKLDQFNSEIFNFDFEMAIGFNYGEVTAGVIGTTKLLYDIWGDTVNVSSRMYSTGVHGKIQVTEDCAKKLEDMFDFEYRGQIYVKGKGDLNTYILAGKKPGAQWD